MNRKLRIPGGSVLSAIPLTILIIVGAVVLLEARLNDLASCFSSIKTEIEQEVLGIRSDSATPQYAKTLPLQKLEFMLAVTSPALRAAAIRATGERGEAKLIPTLIRMLSDESMLDEAPARTPVATAQLAKQALTDILRIRIGEEPGNVAVLTPFFEAAIRGSLQERKGCIEIIGDVKEPLALPLLSGIAETDENQELRACARAAIFRISDEKPDAEAYKLVRRTQLQVAAVMFVSMIALIGFALKLAFRAEGRRFGMLAVVPIVLCGGFASLLTIDHWRGRIDIGSVSRAIDHEDAMALRTMFYQDYSKYPGDSAIARLLIRIGVPGVIRTLNRIPAIEPDDFDYLRQSYKKKIEWILARIVASRLESPELLELARSDDSDIRLALVNTLNRLAVANDRSVEALTVLADDSDPRIAGNARKALTQSSKFVRWPNLGSCSAWFSTS